MSKASVLFVVAAMFAGSVLAAENGSGSVTPNLDKGTKVLEGAGSIDVMADELQIQLAYGQFIADGVEVALLAGLIDNDRYMSTELGLRAEYNIILDSPLVPFLSASVVWADVEADDSGLDTDAAVFSVGGGVKYFIRDNVALALSGNYLIATDDIFIDSDDGKLNDDEVRILFSVRFYFD
ncbi:MAG TPA: outer membrane beta-barrel protein [Kiritimatiellia bacterium]|nr:outer membrane beta-barrel protein [Kiritimatiellia bacterium]HMP00688.1 outer membrane beta-barrel protein [Kiritimatiellia bacterium]HMP97949.1 outer membrane beta-barrel protein [Kiritimatiellia bacterium]